MVVGLTLAQLVLTAPLGLDAHLPTPADNPLTAEKVALGRKLFFDTRLSADGTLSCASCHDPKRAFSDGRAVAIGIAGQKGPRNSPALINRGYGTLQFLDGRVKSLEEQALEPVFNAKELGLPKGELTRRTGLGQRAIAQALASYVRTIRSGDAPFDRYLAGDREALPAEARHGLALFRGKAGCVLCHVGPNLSDEKFHNTGVAWDGARIRDEGRYSVTRVDQDRGAFRTPTLREVAATAPYMHDGSLATLAEVIEYYDRGGRPHPHQDADIRPLGLDAAEKQALLAFLHSLSGRVREGLE
jgi:cytochrome c peroxidase